jgi:hypothetical protein
LDNKYNLIDPDHWSFIDGGLITKAPEDSKPSFGLESISVAFEIEFTQVIYSQIRQHSKQAYVMNC